MPSSTANVTASLSANGTSTASGTMTWTAPSLPAGATITSVRISGTYSWSGRGNITRVTINGTNCSPDVAFDVALSNSVSPPITVTCVGNNKNATGNNFRWSNLIVTYTYEVPSSDTLLYKSNGAWVVASKAYKKVNGVWVEQSDLTAVFDSSKNYVKG